MSHISYFGNEEYSFTITRDEKGRKIGKLVNIKTGDILSDNMFQRVMPENVPNLLNVAKVIISAAWQDGKILPSERKAFDEAFKNVNFSHKQKKEIEKEFVDPTPIKKLIKNIKTREEKLLILETSLLLVVADNEFHPKEKTFIETIVKEFDLDSHDFVLLYNILPEKVKKYIVKENIHEKLEINADEIRVVDKFTKKKKDKEVSHDQVYHHFIDSWKNRSTRYRRLSVY
jgi:tellurite resistance protein